MLVAAALLAALIVVSGAVTVAVNWRDSDNRRALVLAVLARSVLDAAVVGVLLFLVWVVLSSW